MSLNVLTIKIPDFLKYVIMSGLLKPRVNEGTLIAFGCMSVFLKIKDQLSTFFHDIDLL